MTSDDTGMTDERPKADTRVKQTRQRRRLIVESAAGLFVEKGFHQTSVRDIAARAGISLGNLYNHFSGKDELIAEIARLEAGELPAILETLPSGDPARVLLRFANTYLDYCARPENMALTLEIAAEAARNPEVAKGFTVNRQDLLAALMRLLERGLREGRFDPGSCTPETAELIIDLIEGLALRGALTPGGPSPASRKALESMISNAVGFPDRK